MRGRPSLHARVFRCVGFALAVVLLPAGLSSAEPPTSQPAAPRGPKYNNLRYDDDFSYLDGPAGSYTPDFFDPIKNIHLGEDFRLSLGGEFRGRLDSVTHKSFGSTGPTQDTYFLHRYYYHADLRYRGLARLFVQGVDAWIEDHDGTPGIPSPSEHFDAHQLFLDLRVLGEDVPLTVRFGRQELSYGKQRFVSPLDWANVRRTWDALKVFWSDKTWDIDVWYAKPVFPPRVHQPDRYNEEVDFYGAYVTYKGIPRHGVDVYFLALDDTRNLANANGRAGDLALYTFGSRFWGKTGPADYETELAGQWGKWAGQTVQAWSWSVDGGWTFVECPWAPRIGTGFDFATGDDNPTDNVHQTFNQLFPLGHAYFGFLDLVGRQNIVSPNVNLTLKPHKAVTGRVAYHAFFVDEVKDALYNAGGVGVRRLPGGGAGHEIGHEVDVTIEWAIDPHMTLLFGYSHFWDSDFIFDTGASEDPDLLYVQCSYKF